MTLDQLRTFDALVNAGSFHGAAAVVHRSQPAVSQQIRSLELEFGHQLVDRKTCTPTPAGQVLHERAQVLLREASELERQMSDLDPLAPASLRVGTSDTTALYVLPPVVRAFSERYPQTRLMLANRSSDALAEMVARNQLDLGIVTLPVRREGIREHDLFDEEMVLVTPRNHPLGTRACVALTDLRGEPLLMLDTSTRTGRLLREDFRKAGFTPQIVLDTVSFEVIKRYVAAGVGVSFLPRIAVGADDPGVHTVPVPGLSRVRIGAVWRRGAYQTRAEKDFLELMRSLRV
jgi:LysR family transcriptional regulator, hydrogen peroxide-inducible genes activator